VKFLAKTPLLLLATSLTAGLLYAQPRTGADAAPAPASKDAPAARLSVRDMSARSTDIGKQVRLDLQRVTFLQVQARKAKDIIRLNCVNDALIELKPLANAIDRDSETLAGLLLDESEQRHEVFDGMVEKAESARKQREAAEACAGEAEISADSDNNYTAPDFDLDPTEDSSTSDPLVEPPGYASPFN